VLEIVYRSVISYLNINQIIVFIQTFKITLKLSIRLNQIVIFKLMRVKMRESLFA
jgi:hypothetical protein